MPLRLSQSHLNVLACCPRKFQHVYLDQLVLPIAPEQRSHLEWGNQFHLLMQQQALGLPISSGEGPLHPIQTCVSRFIAAVPHLFTPEEGRVQESEHRRTLDMQGYLLTVVYDSLILEGDRAEILDWKTYAKPQTTHWLEQSWQTRLYLFVLAETSAYAPEQLSMTYWFVPPQLGDQPPPHMTIRYSSAQHQTTRRDLSRLLSQLTQWLEDYQRGQPFPQVLEAEQVCPDCSFTVRCDRVAPLAEDPTETTDLRAQAVRPLAHRPAIPAISDIEEVAL